MHLWCFLFVGENHSWVNLITNYPYHLVDLIEIAVWNTKAVFSTVPGIPSGGHQIWMWHGFLYVPASNLSAEPFWCEPFRCAWHAHRIHRREASTGTSREGRTWFSWVSRIYTYSYRSLLKFSLCTVRSVLATDCKLVWFWPPNVNRLQFYWCQCWCCRTKYERRLKMTSVFIISTAITYRWQTVKILQFTYCTLGELISSVRVQPVSATACAKHLLSWTKKEKKKKAKSKRKEGWKNQQQRLVVVFF